jgi:hypothetical protein
MNNPLTFIDPSGFASACVGVTMEGYDHTGCSTVDPFPSAGGALMNWAGDNGASVPTTTDLLNALIGMSLANLIDEQKDKEKDKDSEKPQKPQCTRSGTRKNKSQLAFTAGLQAGGDFRLGPAKLSAQANFGRQEWNAVGPNTVSKGAELQVDIVVGRVGLQAERSAPGTTQAAVTNIYGQTVQPGVSVDDLLAGHPWEVKPAGEFRGLSVDSDLVVGFDVDALLGVKAQIDLDWLFLTLNDLLNGC